MVFKENMKKKCLCCKTEKTINQFYADRKGKDGLHCYCKLCTNKKSREYYMKNRDKLAVSKKRYFQSEDGIKTLRRAYKKYPERWAAREKLRYWVKNGRIAKLACEKCGNFLTEAHHHNGYDGDNFKEIWWLCRKHHKMADNKRLILYLQDNKAHK
jgi:hypothetical protein